MKKSLFIMLIGLITSSMAFTSCGSNDAASNGQGSTMVNVIDYTESVIGVGYYDLPRTLELDAEYVAMNYGEAYYYCSTVTLDQNVDEADSVEVISIKSVYQLKDENKGITITHPVTPAGKETATTYEVFEGYWLECLPVELPIKMSVNEAVARLNQADIIKPKTRTVVIRKPLVANADGTYYIFGTNQTGFVGVNVDTKDVKVMK